MIKSLLIPQEQLLNTLCYLYGITAKAEIELLKSLLKHSGNGQVLLSASLRTAIERENNLSGSSFSQALSRLKSKHVLRQVDKTITLCPALNDWDRVTGILLKIK